MPHRLTTEKFIERAKAVHGDRFDYSETKFVNSKTKLSIRCRSHGTWFQLPGNHVAGKGCRACTGLERLTTAEFVRRSQEKHGAKYDYSKSEYVNQQTRVRIICPIHSEFLQLPSDHYYAGNGCNRCAAEERGLSRRLTTEEFIQSAKGIHGESYDYSQAGYVHNHVEVTIICPEHGPFQQVPKNHIRGRGCPTCGGGQLLTTAQFIERSEEIHSGRYDYSIVEYVNAKTAVSIICDEHGVYSQRPVDHLNGHGCQICAAIVRGEKKRLTKEEFIKRAEDVHDDQYDYSLVEYVNHETNVTIICPEHGRFLQRPSSHLAGGGCGDCAREKRSHTAEAFIQLAQEVHGDRYDYSQVEYVNVTTKIAIICPEHGPYQKTPASHVYGKSGCAECSGMAPLTTSRFIEKAKAMHGEKYDYSQVDCQGGKTDVIIICPEHGPFWQLPTNHYRGKGCPDCGGSKPHTTQSFIEAADEVHGNRYDYSQVDYDNNKVLIAIICPDHGTFTQIAAAHLRGSGCPDCAAHGFNPSEPGMLYYVAITTNEGDTLYKIGITNRTVEARFAGPDSARIRIVKTWGFAVGRAAKERESEVLFQFEAYRYYGPDILVGAGNTEMFTHDVLGLDQGDHERGQSVVDAAANLIARPIQHDFGFR